MLFLVDEFSVDPSIPAAFVGLTIGSIMYSIAAFLIACLILWLIIYSAVRAALTSHARQQKDDAEFARQIAAQRSA